MTPHPPAALAALASAMTQVLPPGTRVEQAQGEPTVHVGLPNRYYAHVKLTGVSRVSGRLNAYIEVSAAGQGAIENIQFYSATPVDVAERLLRYAHRPAPEGEALLPPAADDPALLRAQVEAVRQRLAEYGDQPHLEGGPTAAPCARCVIDGITAALDTARPA